MRIKRENEEEVGVSMGPLIDAVFLLLIFFLVATMLKEKDKDINISLPDSSSAERVRPDDDQLVLGISAEGEVYWEGQLASTNQLHLRLRELAVTNPNVRVRLDADAETPIERVVEVLETCRFRGLQNVGIRTYDRFYNTR